MKWHENEVQLSRQRRASAVGDAQGKEGKGSNVGSIRATVVDESRKETAVSGTCLCYSYRQLVQLVRL